MSSWTARPGREQPPPSAATWISLTVIAPLLWALLWLFARTNRSLEQRPIQLALFFGAFAAFLVAAAAVWRVGRFASPRLVWFIIVSGILFRITLASALPITTSDIYRYLWEGRVVRAGHNPFRDPPDSPRLVELRAWPWEWVSFRRVPAAYPPVAQYVFALSDVTSGGFSPATRTLVLKLILAAFDMGAVLLLPGLLVGLGRPPAWVLLYAWHPLVVGEVVARGHLDSIGIFFLVLALRLLPAESRLGRAVTGACLGASILAKGYALFATPSVLMAARRHRLWFCAGLLVVAAAAYLPFASAGTSLVRGVGLYGLNWQGNSSVFNAIRLSLGHWAGHRLIVARGICGLALAGWLLYLIVRQTRAGMEYSDACFLSLAGFFLLSPAVYPWYLAWTVPFLCLRPRPVWLTLTGTIFGFYAHGLLAPHAEILWLTALEYAVPAAVAGVLAASRSRWTTRRNAGTAAGARGRAETASVAR